MKTAQFRIDGDREDAEKRLHKSGWHKYVVDVTRHRGTTGNGAGYTEFCRVTLSLPDWWPLLPNGVPEENAVRPHAERSEPMERKLYKPRVVSIFAGPGAGKSTTAMALTAELKYRRVNVEFIPEYVKGATWEKRGPKIFAAQEYIFAKQHFNQSRTASEVDIVITDGPFLIGNVYRPEGYLPALEHLMLQAWEQYDNLAIFLQRDRFAGYGTAGRNQTEREAIEIDSKIEAMLKYNLGNEAYHVVDFGRSAVNEIINLMDARGWPVKNPPEGWRDDWFVQTQPQGESYETIIQSNYSPHDEQVKLNGDFGSKENREAYAQDIARCLNEHFSKIRPRNPK